MPPVNTQPIEVVNLLSELEKKFDTVRRLRQPYERKWYENAAFFFGNQWSVYNPSTGKLYNPPAPSWRVRLTVNLIFPAVRILLGKLNKIKFSLICVPKSKEEEDVAAAKIGTKVLAYLRKKLLFVVKQFQICFLMLIFGICFVKTYWDSEANEEFTVQVPDDFNPEEMKEEKLRLGDVNSVVCSPFELFFDPTATIEIQEAEYIFQAKVRSTKYVKEKYGVEVKPTPGLYVSPIEQSINLLLNKNLQAVEHDLVLLKEYWEKPTKEYPDGRHIIFTSSEILHSENMPTKFYPFVAFPYFPTFFTIYPTTLIQNLIPLQKEYNRSRSQVIENKNLLTKGKLLIPVNCKVARNAFTSEPGEKIYYDSRYGKPEQLDLKPLPNYVFTNIVHIRNEIMDIAGIHDVSQAKVPSGIRSGLAIAYLQEQDDSQLGVTYSLLELGYAEVGHQMLEIVKDNYIEPRLIRITGREHEADVFYFQGSQLRDNTDVEVEVGSIMPFSKVARQQFVIGLWDKGIVRDPKRILEMLEFSTEEDVFDTTALDEANARIENQEMDKGIQQIAQVWDAHQIHLKIHNIHRKDRKFINLSPERQQLFQLHIDAHEKFLQAEIKKMMIMAQAQQGMMGGGQPPKR